MQNIIWLASYPKSGNTWLRAFTSSLLGLEVITEQGRLAPFSTQCNARDVFADMFRGSEAPDTTTGNGWRLPFQRKLSERVGQSRIFCKTHCRYKAANGEALFAPDVSLRAALIIRNPIDVCASLTNHFGVPTTIALDMLSNPKAAMARNSQRSFETPLGDWSTFNRSWLEQRDIPMRVIRYEDLYFSATPTFAAYAKEFLGITDPQRIETALKAADFGELSEREAKFGFDERPERSERFFWKGRPYHGFDMLDKRERMAIWRNHGALAEALGYRLKGDTIELVASDLVTPPPA